MTAAISTEGLTKRYGDVLAVDEVGLLVEPGRSTRCWDSTVRGKTTVIRMLLGMVRPSGGTATMLGRPIRTGTSGSWARVGHLVETPAADAELSGRENLTLARRLRKIIRPGVVEDVIERLALGPYADRRAGILSLGNAQHLGLAKALLHRPDLPILDEPTNGLHPVGVVKVRQLLQDLADHDGVTIFLSSHLLTEIARTAGRIGILHHGRLVQEHDTGDLAITDADALERPDDVATVLVTAGCPPTRLLVEREDLETYFLRLVRLPAPAQPQPVTS